MAPCFAETKGRELVNNVESVFHLGNEYRSERDNERSVVIDLDYYAQSQMTGGQVEWLG